MSCGGAFVSAVWRDASAAEVFVEAFFLRKGGAADVITKSELAYLNGAQKRDMVGRYNKRGLCAMYVIRDDDTGKVVGCVGADVQTFKGTVPVKRATDATKGEVADRPVIANLATAPAARRRGLAKKLMARIEEECKEWGFEEAVLVVEAKPEGIEKLSAALKLEFVTSEPGEDLLNKSDLEMREVVVPDGARATGRSANVLSLLKRNGVSLLGLSRQGERFRERLRRQQIQPGDVLLLLGSADSLSEVTQRLGVLPLAERGLSVLQREKALLATGVFAGAILLASFGVVYLTVALGCVVALYVLFGIVPLREIYTSVEWSVIVLLGALIPIGTALETSGGTALIAGTVVSLASGYSAVVVLTLLMIVTMTLSDVMNNTATAVIAAPIAIDIATRLQVSPDPFLMAVAVAASCAFLTPIGHKNNTLIMGPGGYRFGDYWRMGLPLEILVVAVGVPTILLFWPL